VELLRVVAVRENAGIAAEGDLESQVFMALNPEDVLMLRDQTDQLPSAASL
jgi:hypothetical protein